MKNFKTLNTRAQTKDSMGSVDLAPAEKNLHLFTFSMIKLLLFCALIVSCAAFAPKTHRFVQSKLSMVMNATDLATAASLEEEIERKFSFWEP